MPIPYLLTTLLFTFTAALVAADASLVSFNLLGAFPALRWVRVHFITLGIISQIIFGLLPLLVASMSKKPRPAMRWDIWLTLNVGFVSLVAGFSGVNQALIFAGGTLIFIAATLLLLQLWNVRGGQAPSSLKFYLTGVFYLYGRNHHRDGLVAELE
jgi:cytochrome c oxidase cbb3-type subunit 1